MFTQRSLWALVGGIFSLLLIYFGLWHFGLSLFIITLVWTMVKIRLMKGYDEEKLRTADGAVLVIVGAIFICIFIFYWPFEGYGAHFPLYTVSLLLVVIGVNVLSSTYGDGDMCMLFIGISFMSPWLIQYRLLFSPCHIFPGQHLALDFLASMYLPVALWIFGLPVGLLGYWGDSKILLNLLLALWIIMMILTLTFLRFIC